VQYYDRLQRQHRGPKFEAFTWEKTDKAEALKKFCS
jgi:S-adenosylmethionine synthetase